jgi:isopenicillin-N epimerase
MNDTDTLRGLFLLDEDTVFLNHGSFGACPRPVLERYQELQRELETNPVAFLAEDREFPGRMAAARGELARFLGAARDDLVFVPNTTAGINVIARSLRLDPDDEVLITDHAYGAVERTWRFVCERRRARLVTAAVELPVESPEQVIEEVWSRVTDRTRVLCLDHVASFTALVFPVRELVRRARRAGVTVVIDGAHAPGQVPLELEELGADFYVGNCHKWLMSPKGAAFLWARGEVQDQLEPLVVSWGWRSATPGPSRFVDEQQWTGTRDPAACLAVPAALAFRREHRWPEVQQRCHALVRRFREACSRLTGLMPICPDDDRWYAQMHTLPLPPCDPQRIQRELRERFRIEIPLPSWRGRPFIRISIQGYNTARDVAALESALATLLQDDALFGARRRER